MKQIILFSIFYLSFFCFGQENKNIATYQLLVKYHFSSSIMQKNKIASYSEHIFYYSDKKSTCIESKKYTYKKGGEVEEVFSRKQIKYSQEIVDSIISILKNPKNNYNSDYVLKFLKKPKKKTNKENNKLCKHCYIK